MTKTSHLIAAPSERLARSQEKRRAVLRWLRDEIWSTPEILGQVMALNARQPVYRTLAAMEREGYLHSADLQIFKKATQRIFGITSHGLAYAFDLDEAIEKRPTFEPSKVKLSTLQHEIDVQRLRFQAQASGWTHWQPGARLGASLAGMKRPDAVAIDPSGRVIAVEIERTIKTVKRYEVLLSQYLQAIAKRQFGLALWVCPTDDLAARLNRLLSSITAVPIGAKRIPLEERHAQAWRIISYRQWPLLTTE
jgi:hypothetical protein